MSPNGAGSQRIVVIGGRPRPPEPERERDMHPPPQSPAKQHSMERQSAWTTRRLTIAGALGAAATVAGGVVFLSKFGVFGSNDSPLMAMGFGLFVIGMVVFCASLIALLGTGIGVFAERHGWAPAAVAVFAPLALVWALWGLGAVGYAVPAVLSLVLIGGLVVSLK
jgi:hypothetical protein